MVNTLIRHVRFLLVTLFGLLALAMYGQNEFQNLEKDFRQAERDFLLHMIWQQWDLEGLASPIEIPDEWFLEDQVVPKYIGTTRKGYTTVGIVDTEIFVFPPYYFQLTDSYGFPRSKETLEQKDIPPELWNRLFDKITYPSPKIVRTGRTEEIAGLLRERFPHEIGAHRAIAYAEIRVLEEREANRRYRFGLVITSPARMTLKGRRNPEFRLLDLDSLPPFPPRESSDERRRLSSECADCPRPDRSVRSLAHSPEEAAILLKARRHGIASSDASNAYLELRSALNHRTVMIPIISLNVQVKNALLLLAILGICLSVPLSSNLRALLRVDLIARRSEPWLLLDLPVLSRWRKAEAAFHAIEIFGVWLFHFVSVWSAPLMTIIASIEWIPGLAYTVNQSLFSVELNHVLTEPGWYAEYRLFRMNIAIVATYIVSLGTMLLLSCALAASITINLYKIRRSSQESWTD